MAVSTSNNKARVRHNECHGRLARVKLPIYVQYFKLEVLLARYKCVGLPKKNALKKKKKQGNLRN